MTFSTLVTPTRESETWTVGAEAWTSAPEGIVIGSILLFRVSIEFLGTSSALCYHSRPAAYLKSRSAALPRGTGPRGDNDGESRGRSVEGTVLGGDFVSSRGVGA
jgi:hypothetical protein